jgi:holo-[acyl-carrier protein] synthase
VTAVIEGLGVGIDAVEVPRFRRALERRTGLRRRLFTDGELAYAARFADPAPRLAARFAVKEAAMKSLGVGLGAFGFHDVEVVRQPGGAPGLLVIGRASELAARQEVTAWRVSITHTDLMAEAVVLALGGRA